MKKISIIVPNFKKDDYKKIKQELDLFFQGRYDYKLILLGNFDESEEDNAVFVKLKHNERYSDQITLGFEKVEGDCAIVCDMNRSSYKEYLTVLIEKWENGAKIVKCKYDRPNKNIFQKIGNFFANMNKKFANFIFSMFGISKCSFCINTYQLFDRQVYKIIQVMPENNIYLRNYESLINFETQFISTDEKIKLPRNKVKWSAYFTFSIIFFILLIGFIVGSVFLYPIAKANGVIFTYIGLMILVITGLVAFSLYFLVKPILKQKLGKDNMN